MIEVWEEDAMGTYVIHSSGLLLKHKMEHRRNPEPTGKYTQSSAYVNQMYRMSIISCMCLCMQNKPLLQQHSQMVSTFHNTRTVSLTTIVAFGRALDGLYATKNYEGNDPSSINR